MFHDDACIEDVAEFAKSQFAGSPYLIMEKYRDGTNCKKQKVTVVYKADGMCYYSFADGTSFRVVPGFGDSLLFTTYPSISCNDSDADMIAIGNKYINTGAYYDGSMKLYGNITASKVTDTNANANFNSRTHNTSINDITIHHRPTRRLASRSCFRIGCGSQPHVGFSRTPRQSLNVIPIPDAQP
ncbi:unnamed protein product [Phytophthora fragariaefolia]|uniref:Unnamed protein product n=1 Tax=Phytophthora fragariaefolia TaxID=1490495 RepID=A0A9W6TXV8_9STRA|nr:unnamed protein product [Phytophthora fragariaefolia]